MKLSLATVKEEKRSVVLDKTMTAMCTSFWDMLGKLRHRLVFHLCLQIYLSSHTLTYDMRIFITKDREAAVRCALCVFQYLRL